MSWTIPDENVVSKWGIATYRWPSRFDWRGSAVGVLFAAIAMGLCELGRSYLCSAHVLVIFLLGASFASIVSALAASVAAAVLSIPCCILVLAEPRFGFSLQERKSQIMVLSVVSVGIIVNVVFERLRNAQKKAQRDERLASIVYSLQRELVGERQVARLVTTTCRHLSALLEAEVVAIPTDEDAQITGFSMPGEATSPSSEELVEARRCGLSGEILWPRGRGEWRAYVPVFASQRVAGIILVKHPTIAPREEQREQLEACCRELGHTIERALLANAAEQDRLRIETERARSSLISAFSHDLGAAIVSLYASEASSNETETGADPVEDP